MKLKNIFLLLVILFLSSCIKRINTLQDVEDTIEIGNRLVENIEKYKNKYGEYPKKLEDLVPEFYDKVPKTKMKEYLEKNARKSKASFRNFKYYLYTNTKDSFYLDFYAGLIGTKCKSYAYDTCSYWMEYNRCNYHHKGEENNCYKKWNYRRYGKCKKRDDFYCIFEEELEYPYVQIQIKE